MKKNLALTLVFIAISFFSFAQLRFGLQGTPTFNWIKSESSVIESKLTAKFNYGLLIEYRLADNYLISSGVFHSYDGGRFVFENPADSANYTFIVKPQYVQVPFTLKMCTKEIGYLTYFARFGLNAGVRVKDDYTIDEDKIMAEDVLDDPDKAVSNFFKLSLNIALGAEYNLGGSTSLVMGLSFINNFTPMLREQVAFDNASKSSTFNNVGLNIGVIF